MVMDAYTCTARMVPWIYWASSSAGDTLHVEDINFLEDLSSECSLCAGFIASVQSRLDSSGCVG